MSSSIVYYGCRIIRWTGVEGRSKPLSELYGNSTVMEISVFTIVQRDDEDAHFFK